MALRVRGLFPYSNGPYTGSFVIDDYAELLKNLISFDFLGLFLVVIYLVVAAYFFLFFFRRRTDKENLLFALFALAMGTYFAFRSQGKYLIETNFFIMKKLEYLTLSTIAVLLTEFLTVYFKKKHNLFNYIFIGLSAINFLVFVFSNDFIFWDTYNQFVQLPSWLLGVVLSFIILITNFRKNKDARLMLYALTILFATMVNDIFLNMALYEFVRLTSFGFIFFILAIAVILSNSFVRLYIEVEDLNKNLEQRVTARTNELNTTVVELKTAQEETDNLLMNVQEGIFLLNEDNIIGDHHSRMLEAIFEKDEMGGENLIDLIAEVADNQVSEQTRDFVDIALTKKLSDKRLNSINPLSDLKIELEKNAEFSEKFVRFKFTRIGEKGNYKQLLGTVEDITEEKKLERKIKESEEKAEEEMKLLLGILHLNPDVVRNFLNESSSEIGVIEKKLESASFTEDLHELLTAVFRSVHSIKGNSSVLGLEMFTVQAHQFEERIKVLFDKEPLSAIDLLDLLYSIVGIKDALKQVEDLLTRITGFQDEFGAGSGAINDNDLLIQTAQDLVSRISERVSKDVDLIYDDFHLPGNNQIDFSTVKKVLIQLVKNSVTHGIESPGERIAGGKDPRGKITISTQQEGKNLVFSVFDDGKGIQLEALKERAISSGKYTEEELQSWSKGKLAQLIFNTGLSTQTDSTLDAGRGIGMDVVRHEITQLGGKIQLSFKPGKQTKFMVTLPLAGKKKAVS